MDTTALTVEPAEIIPPEKRIRFRWREDTRREDLLLRDGGVALEQGEEATCYQVHFEILDEDGEWTSPQADWPALENYRPWGDMVEELGEDDDPEDSLPYDEAENRLLEKAGLTRGDITDPPDFPW